MRYLIFVCFVSVILFYCTSAQRPVYSPVKISRGTSSYVIDGSETNVIVRAYQGLIIQQWLLITNTDGSVSIQNVKSSLMLDLDHGVCEPSRNLVTYPYHGLINQRFYLNGDGTISPACSFNLILGLTGSNQLILTSRFSSIITFNISAVNEVPTQRNTLVPFKIAHRRLSK